jgi:predicted metal-dependent phosphoesterase TrpH
MSNTYKYQMHIHTTPCSQCGGLTPESLCQALLENGYQGGVITDHFYHGNSGIDRSECTSWAQFVSAYEESYLSCKKEAEKYGLDIIFSIEESVVPGLEILCYGVTPKVLYDNPQLIKQDLYEWVRVMRENGVVVVQAHPFREADYIPNPGALPYECLDGVEVFNRGNNAPEMNQKALDFAIEHNLIQTSSADAHWANHIPYGGIVTEHRITNEKELANLLRSGEYELIIPE